AFANAPADPIARILVSGCASFAPTRRTSAVRGGRKQAVIAIANGPRASSGAGFQSWPAAVGGFGTSRQDALSLESSVSTLPPGGGVFRSRLTAYGVST